MRNSGAPLEAVDLIRRLLHWDPDKRIDLMKAMRHPYVQKYARASGLIFFRQRNENKTAS